MIELTLPVPPSVNHYYVRTKYGMAIGAKGKEYRRNTYLEVKNKYPKHETFMQPVTLVISFIPGSRRKRDVDNILKCLLDSIEKAGIYSDDFQVKTLLVHRQEPQKNNGHLQVKIYECEETKTDDIRTCVDAIRARI